MYSPQGGALRYQLMSSDDHMDLNYFPAGLWEKGLPRQFRDRAPRVVSSGKGTMWFKEGENWGYHGARTKAGMVSPLVRAGIAEEPSPGVYRPSTPHLRLEDMDRDGVYAQVMYNLLRWPFKDQDLKDACLSVYNTWLAEFSRSSPDRLIGLATLPAGHPQRAIEELQRVASLGLRGAIFDAFASTVPLFDAAWEPFWSAAEDTGIVISMHVGGGFHTLPGLHVQVPGSWQLPARASALGTQMDELLTSVIFAGVAERHPRLKLVLAECGIGWLPYMLERMDWEYNNYNSVLTDVRLNVKPSDQFRRQMWATFQDEKIGVKLIPEIGEDRVMWASDYPHPDSTFPNSLHAVKEMFHGVPDSLTRKVVWDNTARLYNISQN